MGLEYNSPIERVRHRLEEKLPRSSRAPADVLDREAIPFELKSRTDNVPDVTEFIKDIAESFEQVPARNSPFDETKTYTFLHLFTGNLEVSGDEVDRANICPLDELDASKLIIKAVKNFDEIEGRLIEEAFCLIAYREFAEKVQYVPFEFKSIDSA